MIEAVVFDMDGLLVDSEPVWFEAREELLAPFGKRWTEADQAPLMGSSTATWVEYVSRMLDGALSPQEVLDTIVRLMVESYERGGVPALPGATEALEYCGARYRVGLASGSPRELIDAALTGAGWHQYFEEVMSSDECARGKPSPDVYLEILRRMGVRAENAVVVEDSPAGILAGKAANATVVGIPRGYTSSDDPAIDEADVRIASLEELPGILEGLQSDAAP